ncbi:hypothetical protein PRUPE_3G067100 [Prunus persica]|uniref:Uncharacterized protein n=1 Tax=Prunus persica TaxID=3760 RepID=A0A251PWD2_PRUPE|nr:hypothetical protein PRUPE_3G067100 [Prunus persica]ONI15886.1 hypothetical protein PRUPE_3G067100 [Prunus persica]
MRPHPKVDGLFTCHGAFAAMRIACRVSFYFLFFILYYEGRGYSNLEPLPTLRREIRTNQVLLGACRARLLGDLKFMTKCHFISLR